MYIVKFKNKPAKITRIKAGVLTTTYRGKACKNQFKTLIDQSIAHYLEQEPAYKCAGSFKSEAPGVLLTSSILEHDPTPLIGLPPLEFTQMLEDLDFSVL